jgi:hypothetical protein
LIELLLDFALVLKPFFACCPPILKNALRYQCTNNHVLCFYILNAFVFQPPATGSCSPILTDACKEGISDSCTAEKKNDEEEKYNTCVAACENAAAEAAAAAGGISGEPKCYQDMVNRFSRLR